MNPLGIYISVPFCRAKCSFCNFASGVWSAERMQGYVDRVCAEIDEARDHAERLGVDLPRQAETVYFGGGTPSLLTASLVEQLYGELRSHFDLSSRAEFTVECAPGQFDDEALSAWQRVGMTRVSLGVQSFVDRESAAVGRLHTAEECRQEIRRLQQAGVARVGLDLICGLPHQTAESWRRSVGEALHSGVEHVSVYMLEVDDGSRLGREALAGGGRYGAAALPGEDAVADMYSAACEWLADGGLPQYEISNFGVPSIHNSKYWRREPYVGFGLDSHSMLRREAGGVRWANADEMEDYLGTKFGAKGWQRTTERVDDVAGFEETLFLGLRMVSGVSLQGLRAEFGALADGLDIAEMVDAGLLVCTDDVLALTIRGRMASNEVFERLLVRVGEFVGG